MQSALSGGPSIRKSSPAKRSGSSDPMDALNDEKSALLERLAEAKRARAYTLP